MRTVALEEILTRVAEAFPHDGTDPRRVVQAAVAAVRAEISAGSRIQLPEPLPPKEFQKWMDRVAPLHDKWAADMKAKGLPGREMLNAISELKGK